MRVGFAITALLVTGFIPGLIFADGLRAQAPAQQSKPADTEKPKSAPGSNPFPEDTTNVPVLSNGDASAAPDVPVNIPPPAMASGDIDPVRSPDDPRSDANTDAQGFSSSSARLDNLMPPPDANPDTRRGKKGRGAAPEPEHQETAAEDEKVGQYYLDSKAWKAALSRFQSALVLDPENPDVYWGLGEAQRHLGKMAEARAAYEKLVEYDPDSKHGKEAKKILKSPEMASAPATASKQP